MTEPTDYLRVSYSSMGTFSSCARKFEFDKIYPPRARDSRDMYAADVGKALHAGFQDWLINGDREEAIWQFMRAFPWDGEAYQTNDYRSFEACLATLESMFDDAKEAGKLTLSTVHKAKGKEYPTVLILRPELMPSRAARQDWQWDQEINLMYVACTRAKSTLIYAKEEDMEIGDAPLAR